MRSEPDPIGRTRSSTTEAEFLRRILHIVRLNASEEDCQRLLGWIALRVGRVQALAGDREPLDRLEHVARHWLREGERSALLAWVTRRAALGESLVPPMSGRRRL